MIAHTAHPYFVTSGHRKVSDDRDVFFCENLNRNRGMAKET